MTKKIKKILIFISLLVAVFAVAHFALAAVDVGLDKAAGTGLSAANDPRVIAANIIRIVLGFLGIIAVGLIIYAGWLYMTAAGEAEKIEKAKKILIGAVIGLTICLASFAIASFILNRLIAATGANVTNNDPNTRFCDPACSGSMPYCCGSTCVESSSACSYGGDSFNTRSTVPGNLDTEVIRNVVVKVFFNRDIAKTISQATLDNNFIVEKIGKDIDPINGAMAPLAEPYPEIEGDVASSSRMISFKARTSCSVNGRTISNCLDKWSKYQVTINNSASGLNGAGGLFSIDDKKLNCSAGLSCKFVFSTDDRVDTSGPEAGIIPEQICKDDGHLKPDANTVTGWGRDDLEISELGFYLKKDGTTVDLLDASLSNPVRGSGQTYLSAEHKYNTATMEVGKTYNFSVYAYDAANHLASSSFSRIIRLGHCCNGIKDVDETEEDCGGKDCDACEERLPVITNISPAGGFCRNKTTNTNYDIACLTDGDCASVSPAKCDKDIPNGAIGNFITISGKYFGASRGQVFFSGAADVWQEAKLADDLVLGNANCTASVWSDTQIIAIATTTAAKGPIKVTTAAKLYDDSKEDPSLDDFVVNSIARPGICLIENDKCTSKTVDECKRDYDLLTYHNLLKDYGRLDEVINYYGVRLSAGQAYFGDWQGKIPGLNSSVIDDKKIKAGVANLETGKTSSFVANTNAKVYSNFVDFYKVKELYKGPFITSFEPREGSAGQYVTINGGGFGTTTGAVYFGDAATGKLASFDFPKICDSIWSDKQVIIKVPAIGGTGGLTDGNKYKISMQIGTWPEIDTSSILPAANRLFEASSTLALSPGLCTIKPEMGQVGTEVSLYGEYFGKQATDKIIFQTNKEQSGISVKWGTGAGADIATTTVPVGAITGQVRVVKGNLAGNGKNFKVGACQPKSDDCGSNSLCCSDNTPYAGACKAGTSEQEACFPKVKSCVYEWNFSTEGSFSCAPADMCGGACCAGGTCMNNVCACPNTASTQCSDKCCATACDSNGKCPSSTQESCAGYGDQCRDTYYCPNSPGKCSENNGSGSGTPVETGSCVYNCNNFAPCLKCSVGVSSCVEKNSGDACGTGGTCQSLCGYKPDLNQCAKNSSSCALPKIFNYTVGDIVATSTVDCLAYDGANRRIMKISTSCPSGWTGISGGRCVQDVIAGDDSTICSICDTGFKCVKETVTATDGICVINQAVCPAGSKCNSSNKCTTTKSEYKGCECCCDISQNNTTTGNNPGCCAPLTCAGRCGSDAGKTTPATLGRCSGCGGVGTTQEEHNNACNCTGTSGKFCSIDAANPGGVCKDCAQISDTAVCNGQGIGTCCVDGMNKNACVGNTLYDSSNNPIYGSGSPVNHYCGYFQCQKTATSATCSGPVASSTLSIYKTSNCDDKCTVSPIFGQPCTKEVAQVNQCAADVCPNFNCLNYNGYGIGSPNNPTPYELSPPNENTCGTCCCDPKAGVDQCKRFINPKLSCLADKDTCTGGSRGLCCGCSKDSECGSSDSTGCGTDTCCQARPKIIADTNKPFGDNICRNSEIQATFDKAMRIDTFNGNVIVAGYYEASQCPAGTQYLTAAYKPTILARIKFWLAKIPLINKLFVSEAMALTGNFCTVTGTVSGSVNGNETKLIFKPSQLLEANRKYYVIIKGETDISDAVHNGVLSQAGIGINGQGYFDSQSNKYENPAIFNGLSFSNAKIWYFTTMKAQAANNGACEIDHVKISPESKLFQTNIDDTNDNDATKDTFDKINDSDKEYVAEALAADGTALTSLANVYSWTWNWSSGSTNIFEFVTSDGNNKRLLRAKDNVTEGESVISATAITSIANGSKSYPATTDAYLMVCDNPWPPVKSNGEWAPFQENGLKCVDGDGSCEGVQEYGDCKGSSGTCQKNCVALTGACDNTNFELSYCRDAGVVGVTSDDLPAIYSDNTVIRGTNLKCSDGSGSCAGKAKGATCADGSGICEVDILKEFYFFREGLPDASDMILATTTNNIIKQGGKAGLYWGAANLVAPATSIQKYTIYYGTSEANLTQSISTTTPGAINNPQIIANLTNGVKYYFAVTATYNTGAESEYSNKTTAIPADIEGLAYTDKPLITGVATIGNNVEVSWKDQSSGDAKRFKLFYGVTNNFGASVNISYNKYGTTTVSNLANGVTYYFGLVAYDFDNNPSATSNIKSIVAGINLTAVTNNTTKQGEAVALYWNNFAPVAGKSFEKYLVYNGTAPGNYGTPIATTTLPTAANPQIISNLTNGTKYYFAVKAKYTSGESEYSNIISVTPADSWAPWTPQNLTVATTTTGVILNWTTNTDDTKNYKIYYGGASGKLNATEVANLDKCSATTGKCSININNLTTGAKYYFSITALDVSGNESNKSAEVSMIIK